MHLQLFALFVICITASYGQTLGDSPPIVDPILSSLEVNKSSTDSTTTTTTSKDDDDSKEVDNKNKKFDHGHKDHHEHAATITVDVHNILDLFKQQLQQTEKKILAALGKDGNSSSSSSSSSESYRTADRKAKKQNMKPKDNDKDDDDDDD
ncbi:unnamed protein product [Rotaria sordida]|uniref:Uncharacterized protein n=1 Tax=Rotaria sordida TaxID=392033 RepID=A0A815IVK1_9BILA|nr:unnamed protein product [Rotaria sordida]CAF3698161.1 unnamed protein product [Rotaria sordida]